MMDSSQMSTTFFITAISGIYPDVAINKNKIFFLSLKHNIGARGVSIGIFYLSGANPT
jgi:hypothetical protein